MFFLIKIASWGTENVHIALATGGCNEGGGVKHGGLGPLVTQDSVFLFHFGNDNKIKERKKRER